MGDTGLFRPRVIFTYIASLCSAAASHDDYSPPEPGRAPTRGDFQMNSQHTAQVLRTKIYIPLHDKFPFYPIILKRFYRIVSCP